MSFYSTRFLACCCFIGAVAISVGETDLEERIEAAKLDLWSRGAFALDEHVLFGEDPIKQAERLEGHVAWAPLRLGPVRNTRRVKRDECFGSQCLWSIRGGGAEYNHQVETKIEQLGKELGSEFLEAIEQVSLFQGILGAVSRLCSCIDRTRKITPLIVRQAANHTIVLSQTPPCQPYPVSSIPTLRFNRILWGQCRQKTLEISLGFLWT